MWSDLKTALHRQPGHLIQDFAGMVALVVVLFAGISLPALI